jgi:hypothetical protein
MKAQINTSGANYSCCFHSMTLGRCNLYLRKILNSTGGRSYAGEWKQNYLPVAKNQKLKTF